jgi:hypothetical protein
MKLELFDDKAHQMLSDMLDEAEDRLVGMNVCAPDEADEYLTAFYISECGIFLEHGAVYLPNEERIAADLFLAKLPRRRAKQWSNRRMRICAVQLSTNTHVYFPKYHKLLRLSYLRILAETDDWQTLRRSGMLMLAAATLPGVRSDIRRELRRRGADNLSLLVPNDVIQKRLGNMTLPRRLHITGIPDQSLANQ